MDFSLEQISDKHLADPIFLEELKSTVQLELATRSFKEFVKQAWDSTDAQPLVWNWHLDIICDCLQAVSEGKIKRLLITLPPGMGKSKIVSVLWLAWDWIQDPTRYSIYATYAANLSNKFAKAHRDLVKSDWFQERWGAGTPHNIVIDKDSTQRKQEFENNHLGGRFSTGKGGEVTGRRANIILFDDLNKSQDATGKTGILGQEIQKGVEFLSETLWTRRILTQDKQKKTAIVGICQRLHHSDVAAWCMEKGDFVHLNLPMEAIVEERCFILEKENGEFISCFGEYEANKLLEEGARIFFEDCREEGELLFPQLVNRKEVEDLKDSLGPVNSSAQLQQKPTPVGGSVIDISSFPRYDLDSMEKKILDCKTSGIISVDTTSTSGNKSDWVVLQFWKPYIPPKVDSRNPKTEYYLLDQIRLRTGVKGTIESILTMHNRWDCPKKVLIEEAANGYATIELLKDMIGHQSGLIIEGYKPKISKEGRIEHVAPIIQEGLVFLPENPKWDIAALLMELQQFPYGKHDDTVDALSQALIYFLQNNVNKSDAKIRALMRYYS
jgi:predicted phage terminase large subunit-like protein